MTIDTPGPDRPKRSVRQWKDMSPAERKRNVIGCLGTLALCGVLGWWINGSNKSDEAAAVATRTAEAIGAGGTATAEKVGLATVRAEKAGTQQADDATERAAPPATSSSGDTEPGTRMITRADFGERWPFTTEEGMLLCNEGSVTFLSNGAVHAVNGTAKDRTGFPGVDAIWADNPATPGTKVDIGPIIEAGLALCE